MEYRGFRVPSKLRSLCPSSPFVSSPAQPQLTIAPELQPWLNSTQVRLFPSSPDGVGAELSGLHHQGEAVTVLQLSAQGMARVLFRNHPGLISLAIADVGQCRGSAGGREFRSVPNRFSFLLRSDEVLQILVGSPRLSGLLIQLPEDLLMQECQLHEVEDPDLNTLNDTIPGHETLLLACSRQLLDLTAQQPGPARARMMQPLEASILSLLASLVGSVQVTTSAAAVDQPQSQHVQNALAYLEDHMADAVTLTDLCKACNISARTLQVSFQSVMNRTPLQAFQEMRLTRLRQLLLHRVAVRSACEQVGLQPSGRMAANYKRMFGELPSQTRLRAGQ